MKFIWLLSIYCFLLNLLMAGNGTIKGNLKDGESKQPLIAANIILIGYEFGATTDADGNFIISGIAPGAYSVKFSYIGYESKVRTDIIVRPDRITNLDEELFPGGYFTDSVIIRSDYFDESEIQPISITNLSYEEIRRAPGSGGDVSRIFFGMPSVAKVNDQSNSLIVRGGSPIENAFYLDNIEVPNINHYPAQAGSGGPIGLLNVDFVKDVNFYTGGFPVIYGNRLSSVMEINLREGNRDEFDGQLDLNFSGFGGVFEGPIGSKGSWLVSARRSYLDLLVKAINVGTSIAPRYSDYQWKIVYDLNKNNKLSFIGLWGADHSEADQENAAENDMTAFGNQNYFENTSGLNWFSLWGNSAYSNTSVSFTSTEFKEKFYRTGPGSLIFDNNSLEQFIKFRNVNHFQVNKNNFIETESDVKFIFNHYKNIYGKTGNSTEKSFSGINVNRKFNEIKVGTGINYIAKISNRFTVNPGIRADYFSFTEKVNFSPRLSFSYKINKRTSLNGAAGYFKQDLPELILSQNYNRRNLKMPKAIHFILGGDYLLTESIKLKIEVYEKIYDSFPVDPSEAKMFVIDETFLEDNFYGYHSVLTSTGKAKSYGIEVTLQKKLAQDFYGIAGFSYFRTKFNNGDGWKNRIFDNRIIINVEGGYKPNNRWEFSARWIYAGGTPYTPFDISTSQTVNSGVYDLSQLNAARFPDYHSLNVRFDKRFLFERSNIVFYISIWNTYNRKNIAGYYWNETDNKKDEITQWMLLPIFGVEYEF